jgi:hypothetical protein
MENLFKQLLEGGGKIISSNNCSILEIAEACSCNRMWVDENGFGFIYVPYN